VTGLGSLLYFGSNGGWNEAVAEVVILKKSLNSSKKSSYPDLGLVKNKNKTNLGLIHWLGTCDRTWVTPTLWLKWRLKRGRRRGRHLKKKGQKSSKKTCSPGLRTSSRTRDFFCGLWRLKQGRGGGRLPKKSQKKNVYGLGSCDRTWGLVTGLGNLFPGSLLYFGTNKGWNEAVVEFVILKKSQKSSNKARSRTQDLLPDSGDLFLDSRTSSLIRVLVTGGHSYTLAQMEDETWPSIKKLDHKKTCSPRLRTFSRTREFFPDSGFILWTRDSFLYFGTNEGWKEAMEEVVFLKKVNNKKTNSGLVHGL
jgi:hypothetical protein